MTATPKPTAAELHEFRQALQTAFGAPLHLRVTDNMSSLLSVRNGSGPAAIPSVSLHHMFVRADAATLRALAQFLRHPTPAARRAIRDYMERNMDAVRTDARPGSQLRLCSRGRVYDLHALAGQVNRDFFGGRIEARIASGAQAHPHTRPPTPHRLRQLRPPDAHHPHQPRTRQRKGAEVLRALRHLPRDAPRRPGTREGRRRTPTPPHPEFRRREKTHPDYERAMQWEKEFVKEW